MDCVSRPFFINKCNKGRYATEDQWVGSILNVWMKLVAKPIYSGIKRLPYLQYAVLRERSGMPMKSGLWSSD